MSKKLYKKYRCRNCEVTFTRGEVERDFLTNTPIVTLSKFIVWHNCNRLNREKNSFILGVVDFIGVVDYEISE